MRRWLRERWFIAVLFKLARRETAARGIVLMSFEGEHSFSSPGQFAQLQVPSFFLRRPISVSDWDDGAFSVYFRIVGDGTRALAEFKPGDEVDILTGLGNGFEPDADPEHKTLIVAGGMGTAPMLALAKSLHPPTAVLGFKTRDDCFLADEIARYASDVTVATEDGSFGRKGLVTDFLEGDYDRVYVCGPTPMMKAVHRIYPNAFFSLEQRMACGFGACMGCVVETRGGVKRVCYDGPVFAGGDLLW